MRMRPPTPLSAVVLKNRRDPAAAVRPRGGEESSWLLHFIAIAVILGILAILAIRLLL